jgi:hypothetical protein
LTDPLVKHDVALAKINLGELTPDSTAEEDEEICGHAYYDSRSPDRDLNPGPLEYEG